MLHVEAISDLAAVWARIDQYGRLNPGVNPFVRRAWLETWLAHFEPRSGLPEVLFFQDDAEVVVGYAPFWTRRLPLGPRLYSFMGEGMANSLDLASVAPVDQVLAALADYLRQQRHGAVLRLYDVDEHSSLAAACANQGGASQLTLYPCPRVELQDGWEAYVRGRLKSKRRTELNRLERRLAALGQVDVVHIRDASSLSGHWDLVGSLFDLHRQRFERAWNTSRFGDPQMRTFYEELFVRCAQEGSLFLSIMTVDGRAVSFVFALGDGTRIIDCIPAFDPCLADFGVGHLHIYRILQDLPGTGATVFDFSKGAATYKAKWATSSSANLRITIPFGLSWIGRAWFLALNGRDAAKVSLRQRGVTARVKIALGSLAYLRRRSGGRRELEPVPRPLDAADLGPAEPVRLHLTDQWSNPLRTVVFRALAKGASASIHGELVVLVWPDNRAEAIPVE